MRTITVPTEFQIPDDLVRASEIAARLGVRRSTITNWQTRYADFPQPRWRLFFSWKEVCAWLRRRPHYRIAGRKWNPKTRRYRLVRERV